MTLAEITTVVGAWATANPWPFAVICVAALAFTAWVLS